MRAKRPTLVITFPTTTAALSWERHCMEQDIPGRLIPVPVTITADCGLAWAMPPAERGRLSELDGLSYSALFEMEL
ncbi:DUF3343 domain-containing protein [Pseudoflavonifractor sp. P01025]|uniref:DUF3343 domain-containing protein n=1 Tax=Flintibacter TaxID=1918454 RepID=UPI002D7F65D1|nr:DUF3343 domain-containing protein [Flintibacter sp.]MCI7159532.1 DUF3343 domain-containing protein [Flintibacter sp.]